MTAIIFDVDGVLVDSEKLSCGALNIVFEKHFGIDIGDDYRPVIGKALNESLQYYIDKFQIADYDLAYLMEEKETAYQETARGALQTFPLAKEAIEQLIRSGYKVGVASSGSLEKIKFSLSEVDLLKYFSAIASAEEVQRGKPAPDVFLLAAKRLGEKPTNCMVVEDSLNGTLGALKAGMKVFGFPGAFSNEDFQAVGADYLERGFEDLIDRIHSR